MGERIATMGATVINVIDLERSKAFWSQLLGVEIAMELPGFAWLQSQHKGGPRVALQQVDDPTPGRNRVHIDTGVADLDEAQKKIESLGGSYLEEHEFPGTSWRVMADPEGNEFCIGVQRER